MSISDVRAFIFGFSVAFQLECEHRSKLRYFTQDNSYYNNHHNINHKRLRIHTCVPLCETAINTPPPQTNERARERASGRDSEYENRCETDKIQTKEPIYGEKC